MWLKIPTNDKSPRKFFVEETKDEKAPVNIITSNGAELRLTWQEADDLAKQLNFLLMDNDLRKIV